MALERDAIYANVRGLTRGLDVLRALNRMESGRATAQQLAQETGLHRTTVRRLLETLLAQGFVRRSESDDTFRLTLQVRTLSEGFTDDEWISTTAAPLMGELLQQVVWPSDLTTPDGDAMIIRETTHRFSPLSFHRAMVGRRLPMLLTASGRAYFANCTEPEQESIVAMLRSGAGGERQAALASDAQFVQNLVKRVRQDGFSTNHGDWSEQRNISAIAVPLRAGERVLGSLNVVYLSRALKPAEAEAKFVAPLAGIAGKIAAGLAGT
ncbi:MULTISPECIES: DNA-binding transcriptional regulator [unclassified Cupriavidus]|uniref:DNA-binding transcriptional regulator n=1 Tax=unclassified Cupriavidus TaxID=2640874 RepID=UPI00040FF718|nr:MULTISPECIES: DNA-binding transcriptional regulator [unclassified Cupriavidus]MBP0636766.1 DNA-binding transcriptional regulator [Cupriavidus sp. AcVe19-6a]